MRRTLGLAFLPAAAAAVVAASCGDNSASSSGICNTTGTLWEYLVVADVDNDGQADIVVASNAVRPDDSLPSMNRSSSSVKIR
jgi:hypothetical protein